MHATADASTAAAPTTRVRVSRMLFNAIATLMIPAIAVQVLLAGAMLLSDPAWIPYHQNVGHLVLMVPLLLLILSFVGSAPPTVKILSVVLLVVGQAQYYFISLRPGFAAALHPTNALLMFWLSYELVRRSRAPRVAERFRPWGKAAP